MSSGDGAEGPQKQNSSSFLAYMTEFMQGCRSPSPLVPLVQHQAEHGSYNSLLTHSISVDHESPGRFVCTLRVPAYLCNADGRLHGGAITSLVDIIGSGPLYSMGMPHSGVSVDINVTIIAGACLGEEIEIEAKTLGAGKSMAVVSVDIRLKATGKLVAQGRHTKLLQIPAISMDHRSRL